MKMDTIKCFALAFTFSVLSFVIIVQSVTKVSVTNARDTSPDRHDLVFRLPFPNIMNSIPVTMMKMPAAMYKYQTPEFVYKRAEDRFAQLDQFIEPNELLCQSDMDDQRIDLLIWIHTAPDHFNSRNNIRKSWGNRTIYQQLRLIVVPVFAIGVVFNNSKLEHLVNQESETFKDIVRLNYIDSYHNVTYKVVGGMRWIAKYCPQAKVMLKIDDDTLVVPHRLVRWFNAQKPFTELTISVLYKFVHGTKHGSKSKWYITEQEWPLKFLGYQSAPGFAYFLSIDLLPHYFHAMHYVPWIWLEDMWITGILPEALNTTNVNITSNNLKGMAYDGYSYLKNDIVNKMKGNQIFLVGEMPKESTVETFQKVIQAATN